MLAKIRQALGSGAIPTVIPTPSPVACTHPTMLCAVIQTAISPVPRCRCSLDGASG